LVILFGALGLSAWLAWADYVLLPALVLGTGIAAHAALRLVRRPAAAPGVER
jgi:mercuric ion transport protein